MIEECQLRILFTSDMHGNIMYLPIADDANTLVIDGGDTIQGNPLATVAASEPDGAVQMAQAMNAAGYDFVIVGNHDFNFGQPYLRTYLQNLSAVCLCANVQGPLPFLSHTIHTMQSGLRVGLAGVVTDHMTIWEAPEHLEGLSVHCPVESAKNALTAMQCNCDITILVCHSGIAEDLNTGRIQSTSTENIASQICRELSYDLVLTGHQHVPIEGAKHHNSYIVQTGAGGVHYVQVNAAGKRGQWRFSSQFGKPAGYVPFPALDKKVSAWLDTHVATLRNPVLLNGQNTNDRLYAALHGCPLADWVNAAQHQGACEMGFAADISVCGIANTAPGLPAVVTWRDIINNYPYSNTLSVLRVSASVLKAALERAAEYIEVDSAGNYFISRAFLEPKVEHYNYDFFDGVTFNADYSKAHGNRISSIYVGGKPVSDADTFTLVTSTFRAAGAGGYMMYQGCPVLATGQKEISEHIAEYIQALQASK
ncbi:MAG: bifunctional metallophosphatase/5'-nucleotidase [Defluviitaleaceae bacterium]|nr:bifunctional metallophosphatase/5'-nucleotidase [Defluviitaleaceae bacterium]